MKIMYSQVIFLLLLIIYSCQFSGQKYDLLIRNGYIYDGSANPWYLADVAIKDGHIAAIGRFKTQEARKIIDASGLAVCPGFIDVHTHTDRKIAQYTDVINYLQQGVTTVIGGNCGSSQFPLQELFRKLEESGIAINFASFVGHNTIREQVMGQGKKQPSAKELQKMQELVKTEMQAGAIGLSTGLTYLPGRFAKTEEIIALAKIVQPFQGVYATHMRSEGLRIDKAIKEALRIGKEAGVPVEISHIKLMNKAVWGRYNLIIGPVEEARAAGHEVYMDQYPYTATSTGFTSSFPGWAVVGGHQAFIERLNNPENYRKIKEFLIKRRLTAKNGRNPLEQVYVSYNKNHKDYEGKNIAEILTILGREKSVSAGADLIIEMQKEDKPRGIFFQMAEEDVIELMKKPYTMIASDGKIELPGVEVPHPRSYGTYPRVFAKYVRQKQTLSFEDAVRKMTSLPAQAIRIEKRGLLKPGMYADIVILKPENIRDTATFQQPHQYPLGIDRVIVNGQIALDHSEVVNHKAGRILYGKGKQE